jgi:hypothetical protein
VATLAAAVGANLAKADATTILAARTIIVKSVMAHHLLVLICAQPWASLRCTEDKPMACRHH